MTQPLHGLRDDLLNLLADVEAGLDFTEEDIQFVDKKDVLLRLGKGMAQLTNLRKQLDDRGDERPTVPGGPGRRAERRQEQPVQRPGRDAGGDRQPGPGDDPRLPDADRHAAAARTSS